MADGEHYCILTRFGIEQYKYSTGEKLGYYLDFSTLNLSKSQYVTDYAVSADNEKILLTVNPEEIYRHSFNAEYYVYNVKDRSLKQVSNKKVRLAEFAPTSDKVAYVWNNNLYYMSLSDMKEIQITFDGKYNHIINGTTDWVYEEEFAITKGFYWNNDGTKIAYYRFDESNVVEYDMTMFPQDSLYPLHYRYKYPKAGEDNSKVTVFIYDLAKNASKGVKISSDYEYIPRIQWTQDNSLCVHSMNRHQNDYRLNLVNAETFESKEVFKDTDACYVEQPDFVKFLKDKKTMIVRSERNGYMNLYSVFSIIHIKMPNSEFTVHLLGEYS